MKSFYCFRITPCCFDDQQQALSNQLLLKSLFCFPLHHQLFARLVSLDLQALLFYASGSLSYTRIAFIFEKRKKRKLWRKALVLCHVVWRRKLINSLFSSIEERLLRGTVSKSRTLFYFSGNPKVFALYLSQHVPIFCQHSSKNLRMTHWLFLLILESATFFILEFSPSKRTKVYSTHWSCLVFQNKREIPDVKVEILVCSFYNKWKNKLLLFLEKQIVQRAVDGNSLQY